MSMQKSVSIKCNQQLQANLATLASVVHQIKPKRVLQEGSVEGGATHVSERRPNFKMLGVKCSLICVRRWQMCIHTTGVLIGICGGRSRWPGTERLLRHSNDCPG